VPPFQSNATLVVQRLDRATALTFPVSGLPIKSLVFPSTGGVQCIDANSTLFDLVASSGGSITPATDNASDLGSLTDRWRSGFFGTSVVTPALSAIVSGAELQVLGLASVAGAVNTVRIVSRATGVAPTVSAFSTTDTDVSLYLRPQGVGVAALTGSAGTPIVAASTVSAASRLGFYGATPVALQTGVAVTAGAIHAALVNLGLITA
jgi:hypothetical protein